MRPILFNIFINDIFLYITETDICNYADDNSLYARDSPLMTLVRLQNDLMQAMHWFDINFLVVKENKFQLMVLGNIKSNEVSMKVKDITINTLFTGSQVKPLYFVQVTEKGIAESKLSDPYGHVILPGERYFKGHYLKLVRSRNISIKHLAILPTVIYVSPNEIYDTYT